MKTSTPTKKKSMPKATQKPEDSKTIPFVPEAEKDDKVKALIASIKPTPAQNVANQVRSIAFAIPDGIRSTVKQVKHIMENGISPTDGTPSVTGPEVVAALSAADLVTINAIIESLKFLGE